MNATESRLLRIKRFSSEQVSELHDAERIADLKWRASDKWEEKGDGWGAAGIRYMERIDRLLGQFWESGKEPGEQAREIAAFLDHPSVRRALAKFRASPEDEPEITAQHCLDWSVFKDGPAIHTAKGSGDNARKLDALYQRGRTQEPRKTPYED